MRWAFNITCLGSISVAAWFFYLMLFEPCRPSNAVSIPFHLLLFLTAYSLHLVSFVRTALTDPGKLPGEAVFSPSIENTCERKRDGSFRYCRKCSLFKPDRAHHCQSCGRCTLRLDHCCVFIGNCIGQSNHKFFLLLLFWTSASGAIMGNAIWQIHGFYLSPERSSFLDLIVHGRQHIGVSFILAIVICLSLLIFFVFHIGIACFNITTIELNEKRGIWPRSSYRNQFNVGLIRNLSSLLGRRPLLWLIPVVDRSAGSGILWETSTSDKTQ
uniref:Palmitoyltransferase n=1 Tax=Spongospora subterranea TaxID=70186 RepID=A0A0H5QNJ2_9EUKA|eukprot:CRZ03147.1 hypothetical protein [Spongospora subterranea]